ncbi:MAG: hypothetical protein JST11_22360 [Acidobacteria bacterium]|nr:hypothetical protein [Acidobacteriota bacterium]
MTSPNIGAMGTLDLLEGGGASRVWSFDIKAGAWALLENAPEPVRSGGAISNVFNGCDFGFVGEGSSNFFSTGTICDLPGALAGAPAPVGPGAALATAPGLVGAPADSVFALRGGGTADFWSYSISRNQWSMLPASPAPVGEGAAVVEAVDCSPATPGTPSRFQIATLRGGNTNGFWCFDIDSSTWLSGAGIPSTPAPVGPGGSIAQLQRIGRIYALRGGGASDFWVLEYGAWRALASTPGPVHAGAALVGINYGTDDHRDVLYALQGGTSPAIWKYDVASDTWTPIGDIPILPNPGRR